jgi:hypothetical protein
LGEERGGYDGAEKVGREAAGPGRSEAKGEHSFTENRFSGVIAMQGAPKVAHF